MKYSVERCFKIWKGQRIKENLNHPKFNEIEGALNYAENVLNEEKNNFCLDDYDPKSYGLVKQFWPAAIKRIENIEQID